MINFTLKHTPLSIIFLKLPQIDHELDITQHRAKNLLEDFKRNEMYVCQRTYTITRRFQMIDQMSLIENTDI